MQDVHVRELTSIAVDGNDVPTRKFELLRIKLVAFVSCSFQCHSDRCFHHLDLNHLSDDHHRLPCPSLHRRPQCQHRGRFLQCLMGKIPKRVVDDFPDDFFVNRDHDFVAAGDDDCAIVAEVAGNIFGSSRAPFDASIDFRTTIL